MLFSYDGPGVRSFILLPIAPRQVLLSKNLEILLRLVLQFVLAFAAISIMSPGIWNPLLFTVLLGDLAVVFSALAAGTSVSMRHPFRARRRGLTGRGGNSWEGAAVSLGVFVARRAAGRRDLGRTEAGGCGVGGPGGHDRGRAGHGGGGGDLVAFAGPERARVRRLPRDA